jgi:hypothetical protein
MQKLLFLPSLDTAVKCAHTFTYLTLKWLSSKDLAPSSRECVHKDELRNDFEKLRLPCKVPAGMRAFPAESSVHVSPPLKQGDDTVRAASYCMHVQEYWKGTCMFTQEAHFGTGTPTLASTSTHPHQIELTGKKPASAPATTCLYCCALSAPRSQRFVLPSSQRFGYELRQRFVLLCSSPISPPSPGQ